MARPIDQFIWINNVTDVASAATCAIGQTTTEHVRITGNTTITSFGLPSSPAGSGRRRIIHFAGAPLLTHNATSLFLSAAGDDIQAAAGDTARAKCDASGNWRVYGYQRASGKALVASAFSEITSKPTTLAGYGITDGATDAEVAAAVAALVDASPAALDTLNELAAALGDDANFAATMTTALAGKQASLGFSANGISLGQAADYAAMKVLLNLVIGTNVEAADPRITIAAGLRVQNGRLTLTTQTPVGVADVTAATSIFFAPYGGNLISIYDGTKWVPTVFTELTLALDPTSGHTGYHQVDKNFDLFVINDAGTIRLCSGPAWTSDTARGTGAGTTEIIRTNGIWVNGNTITLRFGSASGNTVSVAVNTAIYVGSFRASADGQTTSSVLKRFLWNNYNRVLRPMTVFDAADNWTYTILAWRQANANAANQLDFIRGLDEDAIEVSAIGIAKNPTVGTGFFTGIGLDSTTVNSATLTGTMASFAADVQATNSAFYRGVPGLGRHVMPWLERSVANATTTWRGDTGTARAGISGLMMS